MIEINGYKFDGGGSCPEQYDVYKDEKIVAYVRFRWGSLTVNMEPLGEYICCYDNFSDFQGNFNSEKQRMYYLKLITKQIDKFYEPKKPKRKYKRKNKNFDTNFNIFSECLKNMILSDKPLIDDSGIHIKREAPKTVIGQPIIKPKMFKDYRPKKIKKKRNLKK